MDIDKIITNKFDLDDIDEKTKLSSLANLKRSLLIRLGDRLANELSQEELKITVQMIEDIGLEASTKVLRDRFPNLNEIIDEELSIMKQEYDELVS